MKPYRVAIVGLGRMASSIDDEVMHNLAIHRPYSIAAACMASDRLDLAAGADIDAGMRAAFQERWGVTALYDDYREMIERERPDLVAICTRGPLHAEMAIHSAAAGVPMVYLEKVMGCSLSEADAVRQACREHGAALNTGVLRRFDPRYQQVRRWIESGEIDQARAAVHFAPGRLLHEHIHSVDTLLFLLGDPRAGAVRGELKPRDLRITENRLGEDPQVSCYQIRFADGREAWSLPVGGWDFGVFGTAGEARITNNGLDLELRKPVRLNEKYSALRPVPVTLPSGSATLACLHDLLDAMEQGRPPLGSVEISHHATEICFAVAESHRRGGGWVELPLAERDLYIHHL